ncbi:protein ALP1-like [Photinus pyralis]|uniref:protein ALP1-like n=1 Tax=Photinus pyralis TaxID=7054 RepID=UPI0012673356|nr:protein ALP1-like [Photinus pyralis]
MPSRKRIAIAILKVMLLRRIDRRMKEKQRQRSRRWGVRPVLRERKTSGEFVTVFQKYKVIDHEWFFLYTRMTPSAQFDDLLSLVGPSLTKKSYREPLCASQRLAITLRYLSQGDSVFSIASGYKIGRSTASMVIRETTIVIWRVLNKIVLKTLSEEDFKRIANQLLMRWNLPHTLGALDGKHIGIQCPAKSGSEYFNYKKHFSIILLALCHAHYNFTYINVGAYGSQSDGGVLANSALGEALQSGDLPIPSEDFLPNSRIKIPYFFVGGDAFTLMKHLMKPFKGLHLTLEQNIFNYRLSRARRVIENCFAILVTRWRIFTRTITASPSTVDSIVKATVCLHNFLKQKEYNVPECRKKYCPASFCDSETDDGIVPGAWRREVEQNGNVTLQDERCLGKLIM